MTPVEIVKNAIHTCEYIEQASKLANLDRFYVNAPIAIGECSTVVVEWRETYCLWKHVLRILDAIELHQDCVKTLIGLDLTDYDEIDRVLVSSFPNGTKISETTTCHRKLLELMPPHSFSIFHRLGRSLTFIQEESIANGYYETDVPELLQSVLDECKQFTDLHSSKLSDIDIDQLKKELNLLQLPTGTQTVVEFSDQQVDRVEETLTPQGLKLFRFLQTKKYASDFSTIREIKGAWTTAHPTDGSIDKALKRLRDSLCDSGFTIEIEGQRAKLVSIQNKKT